MAVLGFMVGFLIIWAFCKVVFGGISRQFRELAQLQKTNPIGHGILMLVMVGFVIYCFVG